MIILIFLSMLLEVWHYLGLLAINYLDFRQTSETTAKVPVTIEPKRNPAASEVNLLKEMRMATTATTIMANITGIMLTFVLPFYIQQHFYQLIRLLQQFY